MAVSPQDLKSSLQKACSLSSSSLSAAPPLASASSRLRDALPPPSRQGECWSPTGRSSVRWKWFCSGGVCHVMGAAATPMYLPFSLLPPAVAMATAAADAPTAQHPVRRHWTVAATFRTGEAENLYAPLPALACSYDMQLHASTLGSWASSMDLPPLVVSAFVDADVVAAAADVLSPIFAAACATDDPSALLSFVWTCTELLPSLLESAFDVRLANARCSLHGWVSVFACWLFERGSFTLTRAMRFAWSADSFGVRDFL